MLMENSVTRNSISCFVLLSPIFNGNFDFDSKQTKDLGERCGRMREI